MKRYLMLAVALPLFAVYYAFSDYLYGLLKHIPTASVPVFYVPEYGEFECPLFGVVSVDNLHQKVADDCNITERDFKLMRHYTTGYYENHLHLEQKYKFLFLESYCFMHNGAKIYNYQLAADGYGLFMMVETKEEQEKLEKIKQLVLHAKTNKIGLWKEWQDEMVCLQKSLSNIFDN